MKPIEKYVDPTLDWSFKKIFLSPGHEKILITFLNDVLKGQYHVKSIKKSQQLVKEFQTSKAVYFDVYCVADNGTEFIVEVQRQDEGSFMNRLDYYRSKAIANQLQVKGKYQELLPVIVIAVCDFPVILDALGEEASGVYFERAILVGEKTKLVFKDFPTQFALLDLPAYRKKNFPISTELEEWFQLFNCIYQDQEPFLKRKELTEALDSLEYSALSEIERAQAEKELDDERIRSAVLDTAIAKGEAKGREVGKLEVAKKMLSKGLDINFIMDVTGLSLEEVNKS